MKLDRTTVHTFEFCKWEDPTAKPVFCVVCKRPYPYAVKRHCSKKPITIQVPRLLQEPQLHADGGPGTELKKLLKKIGIVPVGNCKCNKRAAIMDIEGPEWCKKHIEDVVDWMEDEAISRNLPFIRIGARAIVNLAIRRAIKWRKKYPL